MSNPRRRRGGGRVTPKGTRPGDRPASSGTPSSSPDAEHPEASRRYTPPSAAAAKGPSPTWVPVLMAVLLVLGVLVIVVNYLEGWPGSPDNTYLGVGLLLVLGGIITATYWR